MSFFKKLKNAISKITSNKDSKYEEFELEDILIEADFGVNLASKLAKELRKSDDITLTLKQKIESILNPLISDIDIDSSKKPYVITLCGVNGCGKTTTVAKIVKKILEKNLTMDIAACDTFRVAATEQLASWASKLNCKIFKSDSPRDPASIAFEAMESTKSDVLIIDTAGRLQNNTNLMNELSKIYRVVGKIDNSAPHLNILIIDATTGQSSVDQVREFGKFHKIDGIIISKMDGGSKGGAIVRIAEEFQIPILGVGCGESENDFKNFSVDDFLKDLVG